MSINQATGRITWVPQSGQGPVEAVAVEAEDRAGNTASQAFSIQLNDVPQIDPIASLTRPEHMPVNFIVRATDTDTPLVFGLEPGAPAGATIDPNTGEFRWTPGEAQGPGGYDFTVRVTDSTGLWATEGFTINVTEVNQLPMLQRPADRTVDEGQFVVVRGPSGSGTLKRRHRASPGSFAWVRGSRCSRGSCPAGSAWSRRSTRRAGCG